MKKITVKRVVYRNECGRGFLGATEYDGRTSDENILGLIHEVGKTKWIGQSLWLMKGGIPAYRITVEKFYQYQKRWYELLFDAVRRI